MKTLAHTVRAEVGANGKTVEPATARECRPAPRSTWPGRMSSFVQHHQIKPE